MSWAQGSQHLCYCHTSPCCGLSSPHFLVVSYFILWWSGQTGLVAATASQSWTLPRKIHKSPFYCLSNWIQVFFPNRSGPDLPPISLNVLYKPAYSMIPPNFYLTPCSFTALAFLKYIPCPDVQSSFLPSQICLLTYSFLSPLSSLHGAYQDFHLFHIWTDLDSGSEKIIWTYGDDPTLSATHSLQETWCNSSSSDVWREKWR